MRASWAWGFILAMSVLPASAQARDRGRNGDARDRHPSPGRHAERREERGANRNEGRQSERPSDRGSSQAWSNDRGSRPSWTGGDRGARQDRGGSGRGSQQAWGGGDRGGGGGGHADRDVRGYGGYGGAGRGSDRGWQRSDRGWQGSYREAPHRGGPAYGYGYGHGYRPRYPSYYRYGYVHRHGYYFPRYSFDYGYYPTHGSIRIEVEPDQAEVYVDGYYAGVVDDFDGLFQRLDVAPGPHEITLRLDGFRTWTSQVYAAPGETVRLRCRLVPGPSGDEPGMYDDRGDGGAYQEPAPYER